MVDFKEVFGGKKSKNIEYTKSMYLDEYDGDSLDKIDTWSIEDYQRYYSKVLPAFKDFCNRSDGYRPIVTANNIPYFLKNRERICRCGNHNEKHKKYLMPAYGNKISMWWCEYNTNKVGTGLFDRYKKYGEILWSIDDIGINFLKKCRSFYFYPTVRRYELKDVIWEKKWSDIISFNTIVDIDITNKNIADIYEKDNKLGYSRYDVSFEMLSKICDKLDDLDVKYKIQSSGNGWYFILESINVDNDNNVMNIGLYCNSNEGIEKNREIFWNRVSASIKEFKNDHINPIIKEYSKYFIGDNIVPYTNQFFKMPYSLHQRLDYVAIPTSLDQINDNNSIEFRRMCNPVNKFDFFEAWK